MAWAIQRVSLAEAMGWTLEYVDGLGQDDLAAVIGFLDGRAKARRDMTDN